MPYSSAIFDEFIKEQLARWNYQRYLDVGCGAGKYGRMIRNLFPDSHITGIEVDDEYIETFHLRQTYDDVLHASVQSLLNGPQDITYDVVLFGDVIEHLLKSEGVDVLHFFAYRCKRMMVVYPIGWHRKGFRLFWTWKIRCGKLGRPTVPKEVRELIRTMSRDNPLWGAPRIYGELLKLGIAIGETSVGKYMARRRTPPSQTWRTFLDNHLKNMVSVDFFAVPTIRFQILYVFRLFRTFGAT